MLPSLRVFREQADLSADDDQTSKMLTSAGVNSE
jgi:hypothetical protein